jgi:L-threonylcarbamoyladenylate synthase
MERFLMPLVTRSLSIDPNHPDSSALDEAAHVLRHGGLVAFPTETVYGLGAIATDAAAVARIFEAKGRPATNPLIVHVSGAAMAAELVLDWPEAAATLAAAFWPGPLSLVLPRSPLVPDIVTAGQATVAVREPGSPIARALVARVGHALAAPSANRSCGISPTTASHVLRDLDGLVNLVLDGGPTTVGIESTVVDLTTREPRILRPGPITRIELQHALGGPHVRAAEGDSAATDDAPQSSPGRMATHYAPRTPSVRLDDPDALFDFPWPPRACLLVFGPHEIADPPEMVLHFEHLADPIVASRDLYAALHRCDAVAADLVVVLLPPDLPQWHAIRDRLRRGTRDHIDPTSILPL